MAAVTSLNCLVKAMGNAEACDTFDMIVGTSTGAIIAFLVGLRRESSDEARERYNVLIRKIFVKSALSTPLMLFTTATYDETPFMSILSDILGDSSMLDSRSDPAVPLVFAVTSKMSSTPTHVALFRNYNYAGGELPDSFVIDPIKARDTLQLPLDIEDALIRSAPPRRKPNVAEGKLFAPGARLSRSASRHPGSFRVLQRHALRASTAAPTVFKPVFMGGEVYCDGGIVASNPAAVAIHEARTLFPNIPIEIVVSIGTGGFTEEKSAPRIGWDGIIGQIVDSATDGEQIHHILEDILGDGGMANLGKASVSKTRYYRLNPVIGGPNDFPIDVTDPKLLRRLSEIAEGYFEEPEQKRKIEEINEILEGIRGWRKLLIR
jgi:calcium-independent phospholipase A2-gamma